MRIGILGYGSIGSRHGANLMALGHKVIFHDPEMADGLPKDEVIKRSDAVVIASPTVVHDADILYCQRAKKPCFVEKPIADELDKDLKKTLTWPLMVGYNMRFHPCIAKTAEWLADGRIGTPLWSNFICAQYNDKPEYLRDGVTLNWSHEIDLALHLLGPAEVKAAAINKSDNIADIVLAHTATDCRTAIHLDYVTKPEQRGFSIIGDKGGIIVNLPLRSLMYLDTAGVIKQAEQYPGDYNDDYITEMKNFCTLVGQGEAPIRGCTAEEGIEVLKVCLKAKKVAGL